MMAYKAGVDSSAPARARWPALLLCIVPPLIWGTCFAANKIGLDHFTPVEQVTLQLAAAVLVSSVLVAVGRLWRRLTLREVAIVAACGILEPGLTYLVGQHGLQTTDAGIASVILSSEAVVSVVLLALLGLERITARMFFLAVAAFAGVTLVVGTTFTGGGSGNAVGYVLLALAVLLASCYALVSTAFPVGGDTIFLVLVQQIFALVLLVLYAAITGQPVIPAAPLLIPAGQWINLVLCGAAQFSIAFAVFQLALRASAFNAVVFLNLIPVVGLAAGYLLLAEALMPQQWIGVAITIGALTSISYTRARN